MHAKNSQSPLGTFDPDYAGDDGTGMLAYLNAFIHLVLQVHTVQHGAVEKEVNGVPGILLDLQHDSRQDHLYQGTDVADSVLNQYPCWVSKRTLLNLELENYLQTGTLTTGEDLYMDPSELSAKEHEATEQLNLIIQVRYTVPESAEHRLIFSEAEYAQQMGMRENVLGRSTCICVGTFSEQFFEVLRAEQESLGIPDTNSGWLKARMMPFGVEPLNATPDTFEDILYHGAPQQWVYPTMFNELNCSGWNHRMTFVEQEREASFWAYYFNSRCTPLHEGHSTRVAELANQVDAITSFRALCETGVQEPHCAVFINGNLGHEQRQLFQRVELAKSSLLTRGRKPDLPSAKEAFIQRGQPLLPLPNEVLVQGDYALPTAEVREKVSHLLAEKVEAHTAREAEHFRLARAHLGASMKRTSQDPKNIRASDSRAGARVRDKQQARDEKGVIPPATIKAVERMNDWTHIFIMMRRDFDYFLINPRLDHATFKFARSLS